MPTHLRRFAFALFGFILLLLVLLCLVMPSSKVLSCLKTNKICYFTTHYIFKESQSKSFYFSDFIDAQSVFTHYSGKAPHYGVKITTRLGVMVVADLTERKAEEATLKLKAYIHQPDNNVLIIASEDERIKSILGMFGMLFAAICSFAIAIFNLPLRRDALLVYLQNRKRVSF